MSSLAFGRAAREWVAVYTPFKLVHDMPIQIQDDHEAESDQSPRCIHYASYRKQLIGIKLSVLDGMKKRSKNNEAG